MNAPERNILLVISMNSFFQNIFHLIIGLYNVVYYRIDAGRDKTSNLNQIISKHPTQLTLFQTSMKTLTT